MKQLRQLCYALFMLVAFPANHAFGQPGEGIVGALQAGEGKHTVGPGESLFGLARRYGTGVAQLRELNGLRGDMIRVGQELKVPQPATDRSARSAATPTARPSSARSGSPTAREVDSLISQALGAGERHPQRALTLLRGAVFRSDFKSAKARYFLAKHYDQLAARERDPQIARSYRRSALLHYQGARDSDRSAFATNARWGTEAKARLASRDPLAQAVQAGRVLARGERGPAVSALQTKLGVARDGVFGPGTEVALKAFQRSRGKPPTGVVDRPTLQALSSGGSSRSTSDAYRRGTRLGPIRVVTIDGKAVAEATARAFERMRAAAARDGVRITIASGFRSHAHQARLYQLYLEGRGNLAAPPGYSNHQSGSALDLNTASPGVLRWLNANARRFDFLRTVPSEDWHWEYLP